MIIEVVLQEVMIMIRVYLGLYGYQICLKSAVYSVESRRRSNTYLFPIRIHSLEEGPRSKLEKVKEKIHGSSRFRNADRWVDVRNTFYWSIHWYR